MCAQAFCGALDTSAVTVNRAKWWMWQPAWVAMAPDGHLWLHPNGPHALDDFSTADLSCQGLFIHEMAHVWQHQQGVRLVLRRRPWDSYEYLPLKPGKPFHAYNLEQQAEIIREGWLARIGHPQPGRPPRETYEALVPFWRNA